MARKQAPGTRPLTPSRHPQKGHFWATLWEGSWRARIQILANIASKLAKTVRQCSKWPQNGSKYGPKVTILSCFDVFGLYGQIPS